MPRSKTIKIDGQKLKRLILEHDTVKDAGLQAGYSGKFFQNAIGQGRIGKYGAIALENLYGIKLEQYEWHEPAEEQHKGSTVDMSELQQAIVGGVVEAVRYMIQTGELNTALVKAIKQAFND